MNEAEPMHSLISAQIPRLRRYARALIHDSTIADDLVQDTLERAWAKRALWREGSDLRAWLFTIMHNLFVNHFHRRAQVPSFAEYDEAHAVASADSAEAGIALRDLAAALETLNADLREVVFLVGVEQMSYQEVADLLKIPIGTVMSRLSRGRERLRALLAGEPTPRLRRVK